MVIFLFSRWRPAAVLDIDTGQKWRYGTLRTVNVYHHAKFCNCTSTGGWVIAFCGKIQNGDVRHFEFVFGNSGPPTKFSYGSEVSQKIWCQSNFYFSRYRDFKILKIWLKTPIQAPKIYVFAGFNPKCYFSSLRPPKGTSLAGNTPFEPSTVAVRRAVRPGRWAKNTKKKI